MSGAKRVAATENPKSVECNSAPEPIVLHRRRHRFLHPAISSDVIVPDQINDCIGRIPPAGDVQVTVDNARSSTAYRVGNRCALGEGVSDRIILPCIWLGAGNVPGIVAADQVYLSVGAVVA